jgi:hypothetical protein
MSIAEDMISAAIECARTPGRISVWSKTLGRYVCAYDPAFDEALEEYLKNKKQGRPVPISAAFKLVFLTAAGGTLLFIAICVTTTLIVGKDMPPILEKTITSLFDLAKIGFGATTGLLGSQVLKPYDEAEKSN